MEQLERINAFSAWRERAQVPEASAVLPSETPVFRVLLGVVVVLMGMGLLSWYVLATAAPHVRVAHSLPATVWQVERSAAADASPKVEPQVTSADSATAAAAVSAPAENAASTDETENASASPQPDLETVIAPAALSVPSPRKVKSSGSKLYR